MKNQPNYWGLTLIGIFIVAELFAQSIRTESSYPPPLDGIYKKEQKAAPLPYAPVREADVFWEKRIWRVLDVREKMNKHFVYPEAPFVSILLDAAKNDDIPLYSSLKDDFSIPLTPDERKKVHGSWDTLRIYDPTTGNYTLKPVYNELDWENVKRFRIKEVWYFDENTATLKVRILGIAPLLEVFDDNGNFKYEIPLFWAYYPQVRTLLNEHEVMNDANDAAPMTWEDIFEMRYFSSYVYKESNSHNRRIHDYKSGLDILLEADRINNEIFDFEGSLWSK